MFSLPSGSLSFCGMVKSSGQSGLARTTCFQLGVGFDRGDFTRGRICALWEEWKAESAVWPGGGERGERRRQEQARKEAAQ